MALVEANAEIFGLQRPWERVREEMTDAQIREFYAFVADLWPVGSDPKEIMPSPDSSLRALYLGENEPELMLQNVFRFCLYADQIVVVNPFDNPNVVAEKFNPLYHPGEWRLQTIRLVFHLALLAPWVEAGLVVLVPDPGDFDRELRVKTWDLAKERLKGRTPSKGDIESSVMRHRAKQTLLLSPQRYLESKAREIFPHMSEQEVHKVLEDVERERERDLFLPKSTLDRMPGQMMAARTGANLEMGMYMCQATGAFPYTNLKFRWEEILGARNDLSSTAQLWSPLTNAFQQLKFRFLDKVDSQFACSVRRDGRLEGFRSYLRKLWTTVDGEPDASKAEGLARDFRDELTQAFNEAKAEWATIDRDLLKWGVPTLTSASVSAASAIATGNLSLDIAAAGFVVGGVAELVQSRLKRRAFRQKVPMSIFVDLDNK